MTLTVARTGTAVRRRGSIYTGLGLFMSVIALAGFWRTYYGPLLGGTLVQPLVIHVHAVVFTGWLALFVTQSVLVARNERRWHVRLGRIGLWYGILLITVGLFTGVVRSAALPPGRAEGLLFAAVTDMLVFAAFFVAAIAYRRRPQVHKRLMTVAATMLLIAAVGRLPFLAPPPGGIPIRLAIWFSPVLLAMAYDFRTHRMVHPAYLAGLAAFVLRVVTIPLSRSDAWAAFTRWLTGFAL